MNNSLKIKSLSIVNLMLLLHTVSASTFLDDFGKVSHRELIENQNSIDASAPAAYFYDKGKSSFSYEEYRGFVITFERAARLKIYKREGVDYATVAIPLYKKNSREIELLKDVKAVTYNLQDGKIEKTPVSFKDVFEQDLNENWVIKKFTFPKAKEGSVLEFYYKVETPFLFNLQDWEFQHEIPVAKSEYEVGIIPFYEYVINKKGSLEIKDEEPEVTGISQRFNGIEYKTMLYKWKLENVPPYYEEDFMTSREDYIAKVEFQLAKVNRPGRGSTDYMNSWQDLVKRLIRDTDFGKYQKKIDIDLPNGLVDNKMDDLSKAKAIHHFVKENFTWNGRNSIYPDKSNKEIEEQKEGNCTSLNLLLCALFEKEGIKAYPVLLSTREHGKVNFSYPFINSFNYTAAVVQLENGYVFFDATREKLPADMLPYECRNGQGLILEKSSPKMIDLAADNYLYRVTNLANMLIDEASGEIKVHVKISAYDYAAYEYRTAYAKNPDGFIRELSDGYEAFDVNVSSDDDLEKPFVVSYVVKMPEAFKSINYLPPVLSGKIEENPFKLPVRTYPVDFNYKRVQDYMFSFRIPEGYDLAEFPESEKITLADGQLYYNYKSLYNPTLRQFQLSNRFVIAKPLVEAKYYQELKEFYSEVIQKLDETLVVKSVE